VPTPKKYSEVTAQPGTDLLALAATLAQPGMMHVAPGLYPIRCDGTPLLKSGQSIQEIVPNSVTIQRDNRPEWAANNQPVVYGLGDDITVLGLGLDANGSDTDNYVHSCLRIQGARSVVSGVRGLNASGVWNGQNGECFAFFIEGQDGVMRDCRLSQVKGYPSPLSPVIIPRGWVGGFCSNGTVENCFVDYPLLRDNAHPPFFYGFQASNSNGGRFINCRQRGGSSLFYADTGSNSNLRISGCVAINVMQGIVIVVQPNSVLDGLQVDNNVIELSTTATWETGSNAIAVSGGGACLNFRATGNLARYVGGAQGPIGNIDELIGIGVVTATRSGTVIVNNQVDADFDMSQYEVGAMVENNIACARAPSPT
jgi:hypothetical protein